jgi:peptidoglycan/LPS O-acetylase OafA/YrhL
MRASGFRPPPVLISTNTSPVSGSWLDSWHVNSSTNKDYDVIDGLRGIAILMVVVSHLFYFNPMASPAVKFVGGLLSGGGWGVTIFFALSGFLISHPFWKRKVAGLDAQTPRGYGWRRFWKIYPPLALSVILLAPVYFMRTGDGSYFVLAGQWLAGWPLIHSISGRFNPAMWSLVVEVHFYVLLPLLFLGLRRLPAKACLWIITGLLLIVPTGYRWWNLSRGIYFQLHPEIQLHFPAMLDSFALGVMVAGIENLYSLPKKWARWGDHGCFLLIACMIAFSWLNLHDVFDPQIRFEVLTLLVKIAAALMLCYVADQNHPRTRLLSAPWLRWCGLISYEWYLFHQPIFFLTRQTLGPAGGNILKYALIVGGPLITGLAIGAIVYRYYSLPILRFGRNKNSVV